MWFSISWKVGGDWCGVIENESQERTEAKSSIASCGKQKNLTLSGNLWFINNNNKNCKNFIMKRSLLYRSIT